MSVQPFTGIAPFLCFSFRSQSLPNCSIAALPSDMRKASDLPATKLCGFGLRPVAGRSPKIYEDARRKRRALPHIRRHSRVERVCLIRRRGMIITRSQIILS